MRARTTTSPRCLCASTLAIRAAPATAVAGSCSSIRRPVRPGAASIRFAKRTALWSISARDASTTAGAQPVVVSERDALQPGVGAVELEHPPHRRAPEPVQRLVVVTDGEQRVLRRGQDADQQFLRRLDVLVLVHEHVRRSAPASARGARRRSAGRGRRAARGRRSRRSRFSAS